MGLHSSLPHHLVAIAVALALICTLFIGSLLCETLLAHAQVCGDRSVQPDSASRCLATLPTALLRILPLQHLSQPETRHLPLRNVVFAPVAEEIVFRAVLGAWLLAAGVRPALAMTVGPLSFAAAHAHHAWQRWVKGEALTVVLLGGTVTLAYTWVFGVIAWWILLRTGSLPAAIAAHMLCNCLGLPNMAFGNPRSPVYRYRMGMWH